MKETASPAPDPPAEPEWVSGRAAAAILKCHPRQIPRLAEQGHITVRRLPPGVPGRPLYLRVDVLKLAASSIKPATA